MSGNPLPSDSAIKESNHLTSASPRAPSAGACERRPCCGCCWIVFGSLFCLVVLAIIFFVAWRLLTPKYTASAYIQVHFQKEAMVFPSADRPYEFQYELFKNTQMQRITDPNVLAAALRRPEGKQIARLSILKCQEDPVAWLQRNLSVYFPVNGEIMKISLSADDPEDASDIVTAVVEAYKAEVVDAEMEKRRERISELERIYTDKDQEVRNRRNDLKLLAEQLGTAERGTLDLKQKLVLEELATYRQQLAQRDFDVGRLRSELASRQAELQAVKNAEISQLECEMFAKSDPVLKDLMQEIMWRKMDKEFGSHVQTPEDKANKDAEKHQVDIEKLTKEYANRISQIRDEILHKRQTDVEKEIKRLEAAIEIANKQQKNIDEEVQHLRKQAQQFGNSSVDVEMLREDILVRERSLDAIASERDKLKVELRSPPRIEVLTSKAKAEKRPAVLLIP